jgi:hypothetical protein
MYRWSRFVAVLTASLTVSTAFAASEARWPSLDKQLRQSRIQSGTALEKLVLANQEFKMLRPEEANDKIPVPLWLRVYWRKAHPEVSYSAADPTGGYPHVLKEVAEWMMLHQELVPTEADEWRAPGIDPDYDAEAKSLVPGEKTTVSGNLRLSGAQTVPRSESDIRINFWNPLKVIAASNNIGGTGQQAQYYSNDGGVTWGQSFLPLTSTDSFHSDPAVDWTSDGTAWSVTIGIKGQTLKMRAYKSTDGGATWTFDNTFSGSQRNTDKELMWVDHSATSPFKDYIYACWHNGNPAYVNRRNGPAGAWGANPIQVSSTETSGTAIGCDIKTNSAGDAFVFWPTTGNARIVVAKSTNGGTSWGTPKVIATTKDSYDIGIPSFASRRALIYVSGAAYKSATVNNVYASWTDLTGATGCTAPANEPGTNAASTCKTRIWVARSTDGGTTWGAPVMINNQTSLNDQFNQWIGVDETTGRVAVMYYDTVGDSTRKTTNVWYQTSADNGATWSAATKLTTASTNETIAGADSGNQYGDYNSLSIYAGKIFPSWTDRRNGGKEEIWTVPVIEP